MIAAMLSALLALASPARACPIPAQGAVLVTSEVTVQHLVLFDLRSGDETCEIPLPGYPPSVAVAPNGMLYVAREPEKATELTTDVGRLQVFTPDGRLVAQRRDIAGITSVALAAGRLLVTGGGSIFVHGAQAQVPSSLGLYDAASLRLVRSYDAGTRLISSAISPDGRYVAALDAAFHDNRVRIFEAGSGALLHDVALPNGNVDWVIFRNGAFFVQTQSDAYAIAPGSGVRTSVPQIGADGTQVFDGVRYRPENTPFVPAGQGTITSTIDRLRLSDGATLRPLVARGIGGIVGVFRGDPRLASREPDASVAPPLMPSAQRIAQLAHAPGMTFVERVSGRRYTIAGELALIDAPNEQKRYVVDCADGIEITEDTVRFTYDVRAVDPPVPAALPAPSPPPNQGSAFGVSIHAQPIAHVHSSAASFGVRVSMTFVPPGQAPQTLVEAEREYGTLPAAYPSCADRAFDGEPAPIDPFESLVTDPAVSAAPPGMSVVYVARANGEGTLVPVIDIEDAHSIPGAPAGAFLPPANFTREALATP